MDKGVAKVFGSKLKFDARFVYDFLSFFGGTGEMSPPSAFQDESKTDTNKFPVFLGLMNLQVND